MFDLLTAVLAAQTVLALVILAFAVRAWRRVRDGRLGFLALAFLLLLGQTTVGLVAATSPSVSLEAGLTIGAFIGFGAFLTLYLAILRP